MLISGVVTTNPDRWTGSDFGKTVEFLSLSICTSTSSSTDEPKLGRAGMASRADEKDL